MVVVSDSQYHVEPVVMHHLRYRGVIWFMFHVLQLLPIRFTQQNSWCINKPTMKHMQKLDKKIEPLLV